MYIYISARSQNVCEYTYTSTHVPYMHTFATQEIQSKKPTCTCVYIYLRVHIYICTFTQYMYTSAHVPYMHTFESQEIQSLKPPMYVYTYISTCAYIYLHAHRMYAHTCTLPHTCHICIHSHFLCVYMHTPHTGVSSQEIQSMKSHCTCTYIYLHVHIYMYLFTQCTQIYVHTCHIYIHSHLLVYICTHHMCDIRICTCMYTHIIKAPSCRSLSAKEPPLSAKEPPVLGSHPMLQATNVADLFPKKIQLKVSFRKPATIRIFLCTHAHATHTRRPHDVARTHGMPDLYRSISAKEPCN